MNQANQNLLHPSRQVGADLAAWRKVGGGEGLLAALADPQSIVSKLQDANLCGMGGAGFPTWRKWEAAVAAQSKHGDKYVVCNANEDEPGTFKDRVLLAKTPHQVIEGVLIAAVACRANKAIMYVNPHQTESIAAIVPALRPVPRLAIGCSTHAMCVLASSRRESGRIQGRISSMATPLMSASTSLPTLLPQPAAPSVTRHLRNPW